MELEKLTWSFLLLLYCLSGVIETRGTRGAQLARARAMRRRNWAGNNRAALRANAKSRTKNRPALNASPKSRGRSSNARGLQNRFRTMNQQRKLKREQQEKRRLLNKQKAKELADKQARAVQSLAEQQRLQKFSNEAKIRELKVAEQKAQTEQTRLLAEQKALEEKLNAEQNRIAAEQKAAREQLLADSNLGFPLSTIAGDLLGPVDTGAWTHPQGQPQGGAVLGPADVLQQNEAVLMETPNLKHEIVGSLVNPGIPLSPDIPMNPGEPLGPLVPSGLPLGTKHGEPLGPSLNQEQPFDPQINVPFTPGEPLGQSINQGEPLGTFNQGEPLSTTFNQAEPLGTTFNQGEPLGTTINQGEPLGTTVNQSEPLGTAINQGEPLGTQGMPIGGTPLGSAGSQWVDQALGAGQAAVFQDVNLNDFLSPSELGTAADDNNSSSASSGNRIMSSQGIQTVGGGFIPLPQSEPTTKSTTTTPAPDTNNRNKLFSFLSGINI